MTEEAWLSANDPLPLLDWLLSDLRASSRHRKLRLFCHACCCRILPKNPDRAYLHALRAIEDFADGPFTPATVERISNELMPLQDDFTRVASFHFAMCLNFADSELARRVIDEVVRLGRNLRDQEEPVKQAIMLREIFGNPFRPIVTEPHWRTSNVLDLANAIYKEWAFERLPILADALMDAGCDEEPLLTHCREPAPHVRGCWALDLILGKS